MQGYCIARLFGGWKYTLGLPRRVSNSVWRSNRSIVPTPQPQQKAGTLHFDVTYRPQSPRPTDVSHGKEVFVGIRVRDDTNGVVYSEIVVKILTLLEPSRVSNHIAEICALCDLILPNPGSCLHRYAIADYTKELCHGASCLSGSRASERPLVLRVGREVEVGVRESLDVERGASGQRSLSTRGERGERVRVLVGDAGLRRDRDHAGGLDEGGLGDRVDQDVGGCDLADDQRRLDLHESARDARLDQVLVLVVVDVEVVEQVDLAAAIRADVVVGQVDDDAEQVDDVFHDLDGDDVRHAKSRSQLRRVVPPTTTEAVLRQQHLDEVLLGGVERRHAGALVEPTGSQDRLDGLVVVRVRVAEVHVLGGRVELVLVDDRSDAGALGGTRGILDLVVVVHGPTVTDEDGARDLLFEHHAHFHLQPRHHVEVRDVDHVVAVQLLLLVDRRRRRDPLRDGEELLLLQVALDVALGPGILEGQVRDEGLDSRERGVARAAENAGDPLSSPLVELRPIGEVLRVREHHLDVLDAVLQRVVLDGLLERTVLDGVGNDPLHVVVRENVLLHRRGVLLLEDVCHDFLSFLVLEVALAVGDFGVLCAGSFESHADHVIHDVLLFFAETVVDLLDRLVGLGVLEIRVSQRGLLVLGDGGLRLAGVLASADDLTITKFLRRGGRAGPVGLVPVFQNQTRVDDRLVRESLRTAVGVLNGDEVDQSAGIGTRENQTDLLDHAMEDILGLLHQLVGPDGQRVDVFVLDQSLSVLAGFGAVEEAVGVNAVLPSFEHDVAEHVLRVVVPVLPDQRNLLAVHVLESLGRDGPTVGALEPSLRGVSTKVRCFHFGCLLPR